MIEIPKGERVRKEKMENQEAQKRSVPKEEILERAKKLKHQAEKENNLNSKIQAYLSSVVFFLKHYIASNDQDGTSNPRNEIKALTQIQNLARQVHKLAAAGAGSEENTRKQLCRFSVLALRAQSIISHHIGLKSLDENKVGDSTWKLADHLASQFACEDFPGQPELTSHSSLAELVNFLESALK